MVPGKVVVTGLIVVAVFAGCLKKKADGDKGSASEVPPATTPSVAQSQDIFDEFYKADSTSPAKSESNVTKKNHVGRAASGIAPSFVEGGRYVVQVATHPSRRLAEATSEKLSAKGYPSYIVEVQNPTPALTGTFFRVRIGGFTSIAAARSFGEQSLASDNIEFWVDHRSNDNVGLSGSELGGGSSSPYGTEPQPASEYQSAPVPEPARAAQSVQPAAPAASSPPPAPASSNSGSATKSEWGNDGW